ncbi:UDP-glycosyltransferase 73D1-like isoform X2 [Tripterygium wilfordii]|uniref:UDP-glycosyltransferase 73D1-like isoform X2 n=1 Tax=Tripterygium wilfordii TaxID=458696 RepID=UPI0018F83F2F|nr:UDP-glycosyltransferase 73D1-like isoform X2 [Tripterygium wilfordii]
MASISGQLHFVLIPLMAQGHMIPMIDMARLIAERGVLVTLVTTPQNASRFETIIDRAERSGLPIRLFQIPFPCQEVGLPVGCENLDSLPSRNLLRKFYNALAMLQEPLEQFLQQHENPPSCIISDKCISWTSCTAKRFNVPRIVFHGMSCFSLLSSHNIKLHNAHLSVSSDSEPFVIPGLPQKVEVTMAQLPGTFVSLPDLDDIRDKMREAESTAFGVVVNSFDELEHGCADFYQKAIKKKVWCIGPVSLTNKETLDKFERGNKASIDEKQCLDWLDSIKPRSVIYACLGSLCRLVTSQLIELGLALEETKQPFIWVVPKTGEKSYLELEKWLMEERFEERTKGRGLVIKGWAPQVLLLSHPAIGGFLTHCGWNSTIEGVYSGVPMITWPQFSEQFFNEKLVVAILRTGVRVGVEIPVRWGQEEELGVLVTKNHIVKAIEMLMDKGEEGEERRNRARELGKIAKKVMEEGGSSYFNMSLLIQDLVMKIKSAKEGKRLFSFTS